MSDQMSRRHFLRLSATVGGAAAMAAIAGCAPTAAPTSNEPQVQPTSPPPAPQAVELRFIKLSMIDAVTTYFNDTALPKFQEQNPGVKVNVDMSDWNHLGEKLLTSIAGNIPIDLVETGSDWVGPYAKRKQFMSLEDYVSGYADLSDFYKEMVDISRFEGKLMALPFILDVRTTCYRKDQFTEVGLDPEKPPETWDDLVQQATKLVKYDGLGNITRAGYMINAADPNGAFFEFWYLLVQNGSGVVVPWGSWNPDDVKFNGPEGVEALQFLYDLINKYKVSPISGMSAKTPNLSALAEGVTSITTQGAWEIGNWKQYQPDKLSMLGIGVPLMKKVRLQYACPNVYAIGTNTKVPDKAFQLMKYMVTPETLEGMLGPENNLPPRKSVVTNASYMKDPMLKKFQDVVEKGWGTTTPQATDFPTLEIVGNYVQAVLRSEMKPDEALNKAAEEVKKKITESL